MKCYALLFLFGLLCSSPIDLKAQTELPADILATPETVNLYRNLKKNLGKSILFGHQDDLAYGVGWFGDHNRSNVKDIIGDYPAVYGWELGGIELDADYNLDSVSFSSMTKYIQQGYEQGAVITISWHLLNPMNLSSAWDTSKNVVKEILPAGKRHDLYLVWLDKLANFFNGLKSKNGVLIPILFRPFHELTGNWFWWGQNRCSADEYKALMRMTIEYLRNTKQIHHLLYAYNTDFFKSKENYLERYPGDDVIDVLSLDYYQQGETKPDPFFVQNLDLQLGLLTQMAVEHNKIPAFAETGFKNVPEPKWWTEYLLKGMGNHQLSYILFWRDGGMVTGKPPKLFEPSTTHFLPIKHHPSVPDFIKMAASGKFIFQKEVKQLHLYSK